jgi:hypothetical protein
VDALARHRLSLLGLDAGALEALDVPARVDAVYARFLERVPFENLSKVDRWRAHPAEPEAWPRTTDRLLRDAASDGLGGTCFSMAYALADLFRGVGALAHTALGQDVRAEAPHAAVVVYQDDGPQLFEPAFFVPRGIPVRPGGAVEDRLFTHVLEPRCGPMLTLVQVARDGTRTPLYSLIPMPAPPDAFRRSWIDTFRGSRAQAPRLARRLGDEVRRYDGGSAAKRECVTVECCEGRRVVDAKPDLPGVLHRMFGLSETWLRAHFSSLGRRAAG